MSVSRRRRCGLCPSPIEEFWEFYIAVDEFKRTFLQNKTWRPVVVQNCSCLVLFLNLQTLEHYYATTVIH